MCRRKPLTELSFGGPVGDWVAIYVEDAFERGNIYGG